MDYLDHAAIACPTSEDAIRLLSHLHQLGYRWCNNASLLGYDNWRYYNERTIYHIERKLVAYGGWLDRGYHFVDLYDVLNMRSPMGIDQFYDSILVKEGEELYGP